eukprot:TRINITY_DN83590_c0_g1_i1.p1 TRINITY_DN83590_c0_g1~~TRINITY_DN83590_c0_g1_i1.p1  ORF type:complete len:173 (-),score=24.33 TRINITY_DN83590_c0_g1_i1:251-748(-)
MSHTDIKAQTPVAANYDKIVVKKEVSTFSGIVSRVYTDNSGSRNQSYYILEIIGGKEVKRSVKLSEEFDSQGNATTYYEDPANAGVRVKIQKDTQKPFEYLVHVLTDNAGTANETHYVLAKIKDKEVKRTVKLVEEFDKDGKVSLFYKDLLKNGVEVMIHAEQKK